MKKSLSFCMLLASGLLVACGTSNTSSTGTASSTTDASSAATVSSAEPTSVTEEVTAVYQMTATYDELYNMYAAYEFYGIMNSDNTGTIYCATVLSNGDNKNVPSVDEGTAFKYKVVDDDGIETLEAAIGGKKFTGYKNSDGDFVLQGYSFEFAGGYSRSVDLVVSETITYATVDAWTAALTESYASRTIEVTVSDTYKGAVKYADGDNAGEAFTISFGDNGSYPAEAKFELKSDFSVTAVYGVGGYGGATYEGTWTIDTSTNLHTITIGETTITGVKDGDHEKFTWNFVHTNSDETTVNLTAELAWVDTSAA
ncbi:MAG: hypothetical protein K6F32_06705 [Bacilli bacterium]|nr:hypothetical protein [Bacilli bacterium]